MNENMVRHQRPLLEGETCNCWLCTAYRYAPQWKRENRRILGTFVLLYFVAMALVMLFLK
jgi:hypothetical protein